MLARCVFPLLPISSPPASLRRSGSPLTLRHVDHPRSVLFAVTPMLFALHQFTEAFVWFGLERKIGSVALEHSVFLFMLYAQGILPLLMPLAVLLMEPPGWRRTCIVAMTAIGALVFSWTLYAVVAFPEPGFRRASLHCLSQSADRKRVDCGRLCRCDVWRAAALDAPRGTLVRHPECGRADRGDDRKGLRFHVGLVTVRGDAQHHDLLAVQPRPHRHRGS